MSGATLEDRPLTESIDRLMPPPRPWWVRLLTAIAVLVAVGWVAYLWGFGFLRPAPDCCGTGSATATMAMSDDGRAVVVSAYFFNSSPAELVIAGAEADLPGAEVIGIESLGVDGDLTMPFSTEPLPAVVAGHESVRLAVTFVPIDCNVDAVVDDVIDDGWGRMTVELERPDRWYPTFDRAFELTGQVVASGPGELLARDLDGSVIPGRHPLQAACALLGR